MALQVKTRSDNGRALTWPLGQNRRAEDAETICTVSASKDLAYVFVNLKRDYPPHVLLIPSTVVRDRAIRMIQGQLNGGRQPERVFAAFDVEETDVEYVGEWARFGVEPTLEGGFTNVTLS
jgi:hypothetical protein